MQQRQIHQPNQKSNPEHKKTTQKSRYYTWQKSQPAKSPYAAWQAWFSFTAIEGKFTESLI